VIETGSLYSNVTTRCVLDHESARNTFSIGTPSRDPLPNPLPGLGAQGGYFSEKGEGNLLLEGWQKKGIKTERRREVEGV